MSERRQVRVKMLKGMGRPGKKGIDLVWRVQKMRVSKERKGKERRKRSWI